MDRALAVRRLQTLVGRDLHTVAQRHGVNVVAASGKINKGWAGQTIERFLGMAYDVGQAPDFGDWELKVVPLQHRKDGTLRFKETMAITQMQLDHVASTSFEHSHMKNKLDRLLIVARIVGAHALDPSFIHSVVPVNLVGPVLDQVKADYLEIQRCIRSGHDIHGSVGTLVQSRTKGAGHGSKSRAFYAKSDFLKLFIQV